MAKKGELPPTLIKDLSGEEGMKTAMQLFVSSGIFPKNGWQKASEYSCYNNIDETKIKIYVDFMITPRPVMYANYYITICVYDYSVNPRIHMDTIYGRDSIEELIQQYRNCISTYVSNINKKYIELSNDLKRIQEYEKSINK